MESPNLLGVYLFIATFLQFSSCQRDLQITSVTSPTSAQLSCNWVSSFSLVSYFMLDLRVVNDSSIPPVSVYTTLSTRSRLIQGLRAGTRYNVTLKSFGSNSAVLASTWSQGLTVPATPQIVQANGISSTQITVGWSPQTGADFYFLMATLGSTAINRTFSALSGSVIGLQPTTVYTLTLYAVNTAGPSTGSRKITVLTLTPPPTLITQTTVNSYCVALSWRAVDKALMYGIYIYENGDVNNSPIIRKTTSTTIILDNLLPCTKYIFGLVSYNWFYVAGEENRVQHETGNIDSVQGLVLEYTDNLQPAVATWNTCRGATSYTVTAESTAGDTVTCEATKTSCDLVGLICEKRYQVKVVAVTDNCISDAPNTVTLDTAPCAPENITVTHDCQVNIIYLSWNPVVDAISYTATVLAPDGSREYCYNKDDTTCFFMNLMCGTKYELTIYGFDGLRNGSSSIPIAVNTSPCDPQDVQGIPDCMGNLLTISWTEAPGAFSYGAVVLGSSGTIYNCSTFRTSCAITDLQCGESLSVSVVAYDDECSSAKSVSDDVVTAPCTPTNVMILTGCEADTAMVTWDFTVGAVMYIVHAAGSDGMHHYCESADLSCTLTGLSCGEVYSVSMIATNNECNSTSTPVQEFQTVPCTPNYIRSDLDCNHNKLLVTWQEGLGNLTYIADARDLEGNIASVSTVNNYCEITEMNCGAIYSVQVTASNGACTSPANETLPFHTVPCAPTNVQAIPDCLNRTVSVAWTLSVGTGVNMYVATLESGSQYSGSCQSLDDNCTIQGVPCGIPFTVYVVAIGDECQSLRSQEIYLPPVPCIPQNVSVLLECGASTTAISWGTSLAANQYHTTVVGNSGDLHSCSTENTTCTITSLQCGYQYKASVAAAHDMCIGAATPPQDFRTAPCTPVNIVIVVGDTANTTTLSWATSMGATHYVASVTGPDGAVHSCNSTSTSCSITDLQCGQTFNAAVTAYDNTCRSAASVTKHFQSVPCTPLPIRVHLDSNSNTVQLSWDPSPGAVNYAAVVTGEMGDVFSCNATATNCSISGLLCGETYYATLTAFDLTHSSDSSAPVLFETAPCPPENLTALIDCNTNTATLSWSASSGALSYQSALTRQGEILSCNSTGNNCTILNLPCGQTYTSTVRAINSQSSSVPGATVEIHTAPCAPQAVLDRVDCETNTATLSWAITPGALSYLLTVTSGDGSELHTCNSTNTNCTISDLSCGQIYYAIVTASNLQCQSAASAVAELDSVPCISTNLTTQLDESTNLATVTWAATIGALSYTASLLGAGGQLYSCNSTGTGCSVNNMQCGQRYNVTVQSIGVTCSSTSTAKMELETAPCAPTNVVAVVDCGTNITNFLWDASDGALYYIATATGLYGDEYACNSTTLSCSLENLPCGQMYNATVTAFSTSYSSPPSNTVQLLNIPCIPQTVETLLDCRTNTVTMNWRLALGATSYVSTLSGPAGEEYTCTTNFTTCDITGMQCGTKYTGTVAAKNQHCDNVVSATVELETAPCTPGLVESLLNCSADSAMLTWPHTRGAVNYSSLLNGTSGDQHACSTSDTFCDVQGLVCGTAYTINLKALGLQCNSPGDAIAELVTAPCEPQNLKVTLNCETGTADLLWTAAVGALSYVSYVTGPDDEYLSCNTTGTNCSIEGLACGQEYSATVTAFNDFCGGMTSETYIFRTAPCSPTDLNPVVDCATNIATLSWTAATGAENYEASLTAPGGEKHSCNTATTTCHIGNLTCGMMYTMTVTASNAACTSAVSRTATFQTAPCIPQAVNSTIDCELNTATLAWGNTRGALNYISNVTGSLEDYYSCNTTSTSCVIYGLQCGQAYTVEITALSEACSSAPSDVATFQSVPCIPVIAAAKVVECEQNIATVSWGASAGAVSYTSTLTGPDGQQHRCNATNISCSISDLQCGQAYNVSLEAHSEECSSRTSAFPELHTAPCQTGNLAAEANCENNIATLSWHATEGAVTYITNVRGPDSEEFSCNTTSTACDIEGLACGLTYSANVTAFNDLCSGITSIGILFQTAPCIPQNVEAVIDCETNVALVSWYPSVGAESYVSNVTGPDGETHSCSTVDTNCEIPALQCGQLYNVTVTAVSETCSQSTSDAVLLQTAPCIPTDIDALIDCGSNFATVSWSSADGAVNYTSILSRSGEAPHSCDTTGTSCEVTSLQCGQAYNVTVIAFSETCRGLPSAVDVLYTVPCIPTNVATLIDCESNDAVLAWNPADGAVSYISSVTDLNGNIADTCNSTEASCNVNQLNCGTTYNVTVMAMGITCNSAPSAADKLKSAPCIPTIAEVDLDCETNMLTVSLEAQPGTTSYVTTATAPDGDLYSCNTTNDICYISSLPCGQTYNASVSASNELCSSPPVPFDFLTAPCSPLSLQTHLNCENNMATLSWVDALGAESYTANVTAPDGVVLSCTTTNNNCNVNRLSCSQNYTATVKAATTACSSPASSEVTFQTVPCVPTSVDAQFDWASNTATLSWAAVPDAVYYKSSVSGPAGEFRSCNTSSTACEVSDLECGQTYNVTVTAHSGDCTSTANGAAQFHTVPCSPSNFTGVIDCETNQATLSWSHAAGALNYTSTMTAPNGTSLSCTTEGTSCSIAGLECGQTYTAIVTAANDVSTSPASLPTEIQTAPCIPPTPTSYVDCSTNLASVQWNPTEGAEFYSVVARERDGHTASCNTTDTTCVIAGLLCGKIYAVSVIAGHSGCQALPSETGAAETAPCLPDSVIPALDLTNSLSVTWQASEGAMSYMMTAEGDLGLQQSCNTSSTTCYIPFLDCETIYNITVIAQGGRCSSPASNAVSVRTGICPSSVVNSSLSCNNNSASFWWSEHYRATSYRVLTVGENGSQSCDTSGLSCSIADLPCGQLLNVTWEALDAEAAIVESTNTKIQTAPCPPTSLWLDPVCATNIATVSWSHSGEVLSYSVYANSTDGHVVTCNTTHTTCELNSFQCGLTYSLSVTATDAKCHSTSSDTLFFDTAPCPPAVVSGYVDCASNNVSITWDQSDRANFYQATVTDFLDINNIFVCTSADTSCEVSDLPCGRKYSITVKALHGGCGGSNSNTTEIETAPCVPQNVGHADSCGSDVAIHWDDSEGSLSYTVTARSSNGALTSCNATSRSCHLVDLPCGEFFQATILASNDLCSTSTSPALEFNTVPCTPHNLSAYTECNSDVATLLWEPSPGALLYRATAVSAEGNSTTCSSDNATCEVSGLHCGQTYAIEITATNENCEAVSSASYELQTAPCTPESVTVQHSCDTNNAEVSWVQSEGAVNYTVTALSAEGNVSWCNTAGASCNLVDLQSGQNYSITVRASNGKCDSLPTLGQTIETVPTEATYVQSRLQCGSHAVSVQWEAGDGADEYTATASTAEHSASCTTASTSCDVQDLLCGKEYTITVTGFSGICNSTVSSAVFQKTVPCVPASLEAYASYSTSSIIVSWNHAANAEFYTATAVGVVNASCTTPNTTCEILGLECGQSYTVSILASDGVCNGLERPELQVATAPCTPTAVESTVNCDTNALFVTWDSSDGSTSYIATAVGTHGQNLTSTTDATNVEIPGLQCGEFYNVTVVAVREDYQSPSSPPVETAAVPCTPQNLIADVHCENSTILATWKPVSGAASYVATAIGKDGVPVLCNSTESTCTLTGLACGNNYSITVRTSDGVCQSAASTTVYFTTEPCQPSIVAADYMFNSAAVAWHACEGATSYTATVEGSNGHVATCITTEIFCKIPDLLCGQVYTAYVTAKNEKCNITSNFTKEIITSPCSPQNVSATLIHEGFAAEVTWEPSTGAVLYIVIAEGSTDSTTHSCQTQNTACEINNLLCGNKYTFTVTAVGISSNTTADVSFSLESAPCPPQSFTAVMHCDSNSVSASWLASDGAMFYTVLADGFEGGNASCNTTATHCELLGLPCGMECNLTVIAGSSTSQSVPSNTQGIKTGPCDPQDVIASINCDTNVASLSWQPSAGAVSYAAFASGLNVNTESCNTTATFCDIDGLDCGQVYNVTVVALDDACHSVPSATAELTTAPCFPLNADARVVCETGVIGVTWDHGRGAESYTAIARGMDGYNSSCSTKDTRCDIGDLHCGVYYSISVVAENFQCNTSASVAGLLQTAPCLPAYAEGVFDCATNNAQVSWSESSSGASYYTVMAENEFGVVGTCSSTLPSCQIPSLSCGHVYSFSVQAGNGQCNASLTASNETRSAPCPPREVFAVPECTTNTAHVSWLPSEGALSYMAVVNANGNSTTCNTTSTNCTFFELQCGTLYSVTVVALDDKCNSLAAPTSNFQTAPCIPTVIETIMDCDNNSIFVTWDYTDGAVLYEVTVESGEGSTYTYATWNTSSVFAGLSCGESFSIVVKAIGEFCNSSESQSYSVKSAPCTPDILGTDTNCDSGITSLIWNKAAGADSYLVTALAQNGHVLFYETVEQDYNISDLNCGLLYNISVVGVSNQCNSSHSSAAEVQAVPCVPQSLQAHFDCSKGVVEVSWEESHGAVTYTATAQGTVGYPSECMVSNTTCTLPALECGHTYDIKVFAENACPSQESAPVTVATASCPLPNLLAHTHCSTNLGLVSWDITEGTEFYAVTSVGINGDTEFHTTTYTNITLDKLQCGVKYNVTIESIDNICNNSRAVTELKAVPCPPDNVFAVSSCETGLVTITWQPSDGAVSYNAIAKDLDGNTGSCNTTDTSCTIPNLLCGHTYFVTVTGLDENCQGQESSPYELQTVPCIPTNLTAGMECGSSTLSVSWAPAENSVSYLVEAVGSDGLNYTCTTNDTTCDLMDLPCGHSYAVTVAAFYGMCLSERSPGVLVKAGPCVPQDVHFILDCETNIASVLWTPSSGASEYHVTAIATNEQGSSCNSTDPTCALSDLQCGLNYTVEVIAHDATCASNSSLSVFINTVPCMPKNSQVHMDCMNNSAVFTWDLSRGAQTYLASVTGDHSYGMSCDTEGLDCPVSGLICGAIYSFSVLASNGLCNSSSTVPVLSGLVPCPPELVETSIYHPAVKPQEVQVSWGESHCAVDYMATVQGSIQGNPEALFILDSYWTTYPDFYIATPCSSAYNVTVTARNSAGHSDPSIPISGFTAPCQPKFIAADVNGSLLHISWQASLLATEYRVTNAVSNIILCTTTGLSCDVPLTSTNLEITALNPSGESLPTILPGLGSSK
ncbi:hypothetical protein NDU88_002822 [Pleurodeles waltl]|uniref:Fibronectin type-III domain-containing protein n=1 Tax=Pleurodeles waltl TaxID=8319 RepID=A0AAV7T4C9_PLEWA|nr:hypothetical protein NDU88_002822 [Pleurodeles waltl]